MKDKLEFVRQIIGAQNLDSILPNADYPNSYLDEVSSTQMERKGIELLQNNRVAVLMVAGGMSTRLGVKGLRGNLEIGPVTSRSIFQLQGEKMAAIRDRYAPELNWLVMTSEQVRKATEESFQKDNYYGFPPNNIFFFQQSSFPILDESGGIVKDALGNVMKSPGGHGGMLEALANSGLIEQLQCQGIEYIFYFQYPNVLEKICDPAMLGYHHLGHCDITTKTTTNYYPEERMGRCVEVGGRLRIIEYYLIKDEKLDSWWHTVPASIATHVWSVSFLQRCLKERVRLPYHVVPHKSPDNGIRDLVKIEQFIFDLLPEANKNGLMLVSREEEYAPVKDKRGLYSLERGKARLSKLYYDWLIKAGAIPSEGKNFCTVEISPAFALNLSEVKSKIEPGLPITNNLVLS